MQRIKRLKDVPGVPLASIRRMAEVEETLDALGTELRGPRDPAQRRTRLLQARVELAQQRRTIDERRETLTHARGVMWTASRRSTNSFTTETRRRAELMSNPTLMPLKRRQVMS